VSERGIRIGTRSSRLAMWQTEWVAAKLRRLHPGVEIEVVPIRTLGDRDRSTSLAAMGRVGVFTKEIEDALLDGRCDVAVHSYKDLATSLPDGLVLGAVPVRADPRDALASRSGLGLDDLEPGGLVGTSSPRRRALILHRRPDLRVADLRGNLPTRLRAAGIALDEGRDPEGEPLDAVVVALAGLERLGLTEHATEILEADSFPPAPAQGALAVEIRADDHRTAGIVSALDHGPTRWATAAERAFLIAMEGGCHLPLGALAETDGDRGRLDGAVIDPDGTSAVRGSASGRDPAEVGRSLAEELLGRGAAELLCRASGDGKGDGP